MLKQRQSPMLCRNAVGSMATGMGEDVVETAKTVNAISEKRRTVHRDTSGAAKRLGILG
ncbi:MAG: hypothetical protein ACK5PS_19880 [Desulfopila sp.]